MNVDEDVDILGRLSDAARRSLVRVVAYYMTRRAGWSEPGGPGADPVRLLEVTPLVAGPPEVLDVVASAGVWVMHVVVGLRRAGDNGAVPLTMDDITLGTFEGLDPDDPGGPGASVAFDALLDGTATSLVVQRLLSSEGIRPELARLVRMDESSTTVGVDEHLAFTVFNQLVPGPRAAVEVVVGLDDVGFNHLPAPVAVWRRGEWDLGIVQESLAGSSTGEALVLTSVRDLYASGAAPEAAGGDFASEAHRMGTMTARMHLAFAEAYGRRPVEPGRWADAVAGALASRSSESAARPEVAAVVESAAALGATGDAVRTHGDFTLARVWRNEQGWYVGDFGPGGWPDGIGPDGEGLLVVDDGVAYRSPLADVADMAWSFSEIAATVARERDPSGNLGLREQAAAWEARNRTAFLAGYLGVPGIGALVPGDRQAVRTLVALFELERASRPLRP